MMGAGSNSSGVTMQAFHLIEPCHRSVSIPYFECEKHQIIRRSWGGCILETNFFFNNWWYSIPNYTMVITAALLALSEKVGGICKIPTFVSIQVA